VRIFKEFRRASAYFRRDMEVCAYLPRVTEVWRWMNFPWESGRRIPLTVIKSFDLLLLKCL